MTLETEYATLSLEQKYAFSKFKNGDNIFITGPGGTGKTRFIQFLVSHLKHIGSTFQVCALTGCAAVLLQCNAKTIHSWSGIKLAKGPKDPIIYRVSRNATLAKAWRKINVLIVDEVSMMSYKMFELLDEIGRTIRKSNLPFGGIQLVFTGDFFQLPPISDASDPYSAAFCFESPRWTITFPKTNCIELKTMFRQTDPQYIEILKQIRKGYIDVEYADILEKCVKRGYDPAKYGGVVPTKLFPVRNKVDAVNNAMFSRLEGTEYIYEYSCNTNNITYLDSGKLLSIEDTMKCNSLTQKDIEMETESLLSTIQTAKTVSLKKGAVVMCTTNINVDEGICNGAQGIVIDFCECPTRDHTNIFVPVVRFSNGKTMKIAPLHRQSEDYPAISVCQIPLCLAWALTIHKIQGATLHMADIDIGRSIFECGQTYVALSRIRSLDGLFLSEFYPQRIKANPTVIAFYDSLSQQISTEEMNDYIAKNDATKWNVWSNTVFGNTVTTQAIMRPPNRVIKLDAGELTTETYANDTPAEVTENYIKQIII
jgi:ATP-dependent DNA helicase PIF1